MIRDVKVFPDAHTLCTAAAKQSAQLIIDLCKQAGRCRVALSGGHTPRGVYEAWARDFCNALPWSQIHLFWGDERYVSPDDPRSNFRMVSEALLSRVPISASNVHPMPTNFPLPVQAARTYEKTLREEFSGTRPAFDLIFLGVGAEGHTASLFPDSASLDEKDRWVVDVTAPVEPPLRLSFTLCVLNAARNVFVLAAGAEKREALRRALRDPAEPSRAWPITLVRPAGQLTWFVDELAHG